METITIQGKKIPYVRERIPVAKCKLDPSNPRVQFLIGQKNNLGQAELDEMLWSKDAVRGLYLTIKQNGAVHEPILVQKADNGFFVVREGNCRTVVSRHLTEQKIANFDTIPAMIFDTELGEEDLAIYLADIHISGKIPWDAYEKSKQVYDLLKKYGKSYDWLSDHLRLSKSKIKELVDAYTATSEFLKKNPAPENIKKFAFFYEIMRKKPLREKFHNEPSFKAEFDEWLVKERLTESRQVRNLPEILANKEATKMLGHSGFTEALRVVLKNDPSLESEVFWAVKNATEHLKKLPVDDLQDLKAGNAQKVIMLKNLYRALDDIATLSGMRLS